MVFIFTLSAKALTPACHDHWRGDDWDDTQTQNGLFVGVEMRVTEGALTAVWTYVRGYGRGGVDADTAY